MEESPLVVILMGPPGAGKGTHAGPLSERLGLPHISTGDLFRLHIRNQTVLGKKARERMDQGSLVPDELVLGMLFERVRQPDCKNGYILDGFPRTHVQAVELDKKLESCHKLVINFLVTDALLIERITGRISCKACGKPFHKKRDLPKMANVCDACGGSLIQREDDREEIVRKRLEVYRAQTEPLIAYYAAQEGVLCNIDGQNSKDRVFRDLVEALPVSTAMQP